MQSANEFACVDQHAVDLAACAKAPPVDPSKQIVVFWSVAPVLGPKAVVRALSKIGLPALRIRLCTDVFEGAVVVSFAGEWQADMVLFKLAGVERHLMDAIGKSASVAKWSSPDVPTLLRLALRDLPRVAGQEPEVDPDADDYDPRKPEYVIPATEADADADGSRLLQRQIAKLEAAVASRKSGLEPKVREHYERVLKEMRRSVDQGPVVQFGHARAWSDPILEMAKTDPDPEYSSVSDAEATCSTGTDGVHDDTDLWTERSGSSLEDNGESAKGLVFEDAGLETESLESFELRRDEDSVHFARPLLGARPCPTETVEGSVGQGGS